MRGSALNQARSDNFFTSFSTESACFSNAGGIVGYWAKTGVDKAKTLHSMVKPIFLGFISSIIGISLYSKLGLCNGEIL
jgi:hypothetical protein